MRTPTLEEKVEQYEQFLHNINMMLIASNTEGIQKLIDNADRWSYMHRISNGELSEEDQQKLIDKAFWNLNKFYTSRETKQIDPNEPAWKRMNWPMYTPAIPKKFN